MDSLTLRGFTVLAPPKSKGANLWITPDGWQLLRRSIDGTITTDLAAPPPGNSMFKFTGDASTTSTFSLMTAANLPGSDSSEHFIVHVHFVVHVHSPERPEDERRPDRPQGHGFAGALSFLNAARGLCISFAGDGGPSISVDSSGVHADLSISLPPIEGGIFTLSGIEFGVGVDIALDGAGMAVLSFNFATQADPFTVAGGIWQGLWLSSC